MTALQHHAATRKELQIRLQIRTIVATLSENKLSPAARAALAAQHTQLTKELYQC